MLHQKEMLEWLQGFSVNQIKHFLTLKNPDYLSFVSRILERELQGKPGKWMEWGYSQQTITNGETSIYVRENYRYKTRKEEKRAMDSQLLENLTVARGTSAAFSVKKEFIRSGRLRACMLLLSDEQVFNCMTNKYIHSQSGSYHDSIWFKISSINSFSMVLIHFFELELFQAFRRHQPKLFDPFSFVQTQISSQIAEKLLEDLLNGHLQRSKASKSKSEVELKLIGSRQQSAFLLQQCHERLSNQNRDLGETIFEYIWAEEDNQSKIGRILTELSEKVHFLYKEHLIDLKCQQIESYSSKKKRKNKKKAEQKSQVIQQVAQQPQQPPKPTVKIKPKLEEPQEGNRGRNKQIKQIKSVKKGQSQERRKASQQRKLTKVIQERINENLQLYYQKLYQKSSGFEKYRRACFQMIEQALKGLQLKCPWRLQIFGSCSIDFALRQSDLDLLLIVEDKSACRLKDVQLILKVKQWLRGCCVIEAARVPIVQFQVPIAELRHPKIKETKRPLGNIHVDISLSFGGQQHEGISNTSFLKMLFTQHPSLQVLCLILKDLLRVSNLNKPYIGGISSYVLVVLVYNILMRKEVAIDQDLARQMRTVATYLSTEFKPYVTLVTAFKDSELKASEQISLNLEHPQDRQLLHTSARLINDIIALFKQLDVTLRIIQCEMAAINIQERRKMKKIFFENWNRLLQSQQEEIEK